MKKLLLCLMIVVSWFSAIFASNVWDDETKSMYTREQGKVLDDSWIEDPLADWTLSSAKGLTWIAKISDLSDDWKRGWFMDYVAIWVNYILALLWMIVIIFIVKDWIVMITSAWDENKKNEAWKNVRNYIFAIIFIGVAYLIVNLIFKFVNINT